MTIGSVNARLEPVIDVRVIGPAAVADVVAVIDTGFTAYLTLPPVVVASLGLVRKARGTAVIADGSQPHFDVFEAEVEWRGVRQAVYVYAIGDDVLAGMTLLAGHELRIEVAPGGLIELYPLP